MNLLLLLALLLPIPGQSKQASADEILKHGLELARLGRVEEAESILDQGRRAYPADERFLVEMAGLAYRRKDTSLAKQRLRQALRRNPKHRYANDFLAALYLMERNLPAALKYWNQIGKPLIQNLHIEPPLNVADILRDRSIMISPGQLLTLDRLRATESNLDRLGVLSTYQWTLTPQSGDRFDLAFRYLPAEHSSRGWLWKLAPMLRGLPYQAIHIDRRNIGRRAMDFTSLWRWDPNKRRIAAAFSGFLRTDPRFKYSLSLDMRDEDWDVTSTYRGQPGGLESLLLRRYEAGVHVDIAVSEKLSWTTGLQITARRYGHHDGNQLFADGWSLQMPNRLAYELYRWPERRARVRVHAQLTPGRVLTGAPSRFLITEGGLSAAWQPGTNEDGWLLTAHTLAGATLGRVLFDQYFQLGMERDNDLWLRSRVGTRDGKKGSAPLGTGFALFQSDFTYPVFRLPFLTVRTGPFLDLGRISDRSHQFGSQGWLYGTGLQASVTVMRSLTVRLVYGRDLRNGGDVFYTAVSR